MRTRINRYQLGLKILDMMGFRDQSHLVQKADRCLDNIERVEELILEDPSLDEFRPKELDEVLREDRFGFAVLTDK
jgi:hypothetical protein